MRDEQDGRRVWWWSGLAPWLVYLGLTLAVYGRAAGYPFLLDDVFHFRDNPSVRSPSGLWTVWTSNYWEGYGRGGLYRPLLKTLWAAEHVLLGGGRAVVLGLSAALHALNGVLVAAVARHAGVGGALALAAGAWFVLHPAHSEVVIAGVGQGEIVSLALVLGALRLVLPDERVTPARGIAFVALALASLLVKEQGFAALGFLGAALWMNRSVPRRTKGILTGMLALGVAAVVILRLEILGSFGPGSGFRVAEGIDAGERLLLVLGSAGRYLRLAVAPLRLSADYSWLERELPVAPSDPLVWIGAAAAVATLGAGWAAARRGDWRPPLFLLAFWIALVPFLHLWPVGNFFAERHAYHALAAAALLLAWACRSVARHGPPTRRVAVTVLLCGWAAAFGARAAVRTPVWSSAERLWTTTLRDHETSYFAATNLAKLYQEEGRLVEARRHAERALELSPGLYSAHATLGNLELLAGRPAAARDHYARAAESPLHRSQARMGLVLALIELGELGEARAVYDGLAGDGRRSWEVRALGERLSRAERGRSGGERRGPPRQMRERAR